MDTRSNSQTSEFLMLAYAAGDSTAFTKLYALHKAPLFRTILRQGIDNARAEELFQEIWLKVINARNDYQSTARFQTWLYTIARNRIIDEYRKLGKAIETESTDEHLSDEVLEDDSKPSADVELHKQRTKADMMRAVALLSFEQRQAFVLKYEAGMSNDDIALVTGTNEETAKSRVRYAVNTLKRVLGGKE